MSMTCIIFSLQFFLIKQSENIHTCAYKPSFDTWQNVSKVWKTKHWMLPYLFRKIQFKFGPFPKFLTILEIDLKTFPILNLVLKQPHDSFVMVQIQPGGLQHIFLHTYWTEGLRCRNWKLSGGFSEKPHLLSPTGSSCVSAPLPSIAAANPRRPRAPGGGISSPTPCSSFSFISRTRAFSLSLSPFTENSKP